MTLNEYIKKYNGVGIDTDGYYGFQCMDNMHQYCKDVLGLDYSVLAQSDAKSVYMNFPNVPGATNFTQIKNTTTAVPQVGDLMFWGYAPSGHVAIFVEGDVNTFTSFDQNFPTGSKCHLQEHTYKNVLGWLKPIKSPTQDTTDSLEEEKDALEKVVKDLKRELKSLKNDVKDRDTAIEVLNGSLEEKNVHIKELEDSLTKAVKMAEDSNTDYQELETQLIETNNRLNKQNGVIERITAENTLLHTANVNLASANVKKLDEYDVSELVKEVLSRIFKK